jgi:nicotinamide riboside transporter PnuC
MSAQDILKDSSLVAIIAGILGIFIIFGGSLAWLGVLFLGAVAVLFGLVNYLKNKDDIIALIAAILGIIVVVVALLRGLDVI